MSGGEGARGRLGNLAARLATAAVLAPLVLLLVYWGGEWFRLLVAVVLAVCLIELYRSMGRAGVPAAWLPGGLGAVALALFGDAIPAPWTLAFLIAGCALWSLLLARRQFLPSCLGSALGALYIAAPLNLGVKLRALPDGLDWCLLVLGGVWLCDSAAYFVGSRYGRHKLWPQVSPKKSWEGLAAGLAAASLFGLVLSPWLHLNPLIAPLVGLGIGLATVAGDLIESAIKRGLGVKDMGEILPGHGGLLDRIDGLLVAIPVGYGAALLSLK